ncbi:hypothetical protein SPF06_05050 [Sinomonas sp. JGH33]|uniref:Uncharacterized protein n=1 Tax=Sinomonas terricola TaxID=3110330 RepID=A0ABU5T4L3_9MICC|nr:hypothetical protein [Sinomonas sp. JGH33]MEA5454086.1 hypothetical protein [Sinomonas sp. JGH33]
MRPLTSPARRAVRRLAFVAAAGLLAAGVATSPALAASGDGKQDNFDAKKITYCHGTGSTSNPYVGLTTSVAAFYSAGHIDHTDDIWPAFSYVKGGATYDVAAQNLGLLPAYGVTGAAILAAGCAIPAASPTPTPTQTVTPTRTVTPTDPATQQVVTPTPAVTPTVTPTPTPTGTPTTSPSLVMAGDPGTSTPAAANGDVTLSAQTAAYAPAPSVLPSSLLLASGMLLGAWAALTAFADRRRGRHA